MVNRENMHAAGSCSLWGGNGMEWNGHEWNELAQSFVTFLLVSSQLLCLSIEGHHHNESGSEWVQTERNVLLHS